MQNVACLWAKAVNGKELLSKLTIGKAFSSGSRRAGSPLVLGFSMGTGGDRGESRHPTFNRVQWTHSTVGRSSTGEKQYWGEAVLGRVSVEILHGDGEEA